MKNIIIVFLAFAMHWSVAQDQFTSVEIRRAFGKSMAKHRLTVPEKFDDLIEHYPSNWIEGYSGTTIILQNRKRKLTADGESNVFSKAQKALLASAEIGDQLIFNINYISKNSITSQNEQRKIKSEFTVVTDEEAKPIKKIEEIKDYFKAYSFKKLADGTGDVFTGASIQFTIDTQGKISNASITQSSGNMQADQLLLKTLLAMPAWKPAQDRSGKKYAQQFILDVVKSGC